MKRIRNILYFILAILVLNVPLQAAAAERDAVTLSQDGASVSVMLDMSDAAAENITAVSVSLQINAGGRDLVTTDFDFSQELSAAECGVHYSEGSDNIGKLDIYVVTGSEKSLFNGNSLNLGYLKVMPKDQSKVLPVTISYCGGSFQTANAAYGDKMPMVERVPDPISMQVGKGVIYDSTQEGGTGSDTNPGNGQTNAGQGSNGGQSGSGQGTGSQNNNGQGSGDENMNQGLYDETTQFVNDPNAAEKISSPVIKNSNLFTELADLSNTAPAGTGKVPHAGSGAGQASQAKTNGKVSVVAPEKGPSSIFVSGTKDTWPDTGEGTMGSLFGDAGESGSYTEGAKGGTLAGEEGQGGEEIKLDRKNGGVADEKGLDKSKLIIIGAIVAAVIILCVSAFFLFRNKDDDERKKKYAAKKKKKKYANKKKRRR